jgi:energy-coupling factor transporter ATP-binding protein EcfA2
LDGQEAFDLSVYDKSLLVSTVLQDTDGQFVGLSVAEDLAFALENDMESQQIMHQKIGIGQKNCHLQTYWPIGHKIYLEVKSNVSV